MECNLPRAASSAAILSLPVPDLDSILSPVPDVQECEGDYPFPTEKGQYVPFISATVLANMLNNEYSQLGRVIVVDCRFDYEFKSGHILGATNLRTKAQMMDLYNSYIGKNVVFVFHCEFSSSRGPTWAAMFRKHDREMNIRTYPALRYPKCFILKKGFSEFFTHYKEFCTGVYRLMRDDSDCPGSFRRSQRLYDIETKGGRYARTPDVHRRKERLDGTTVTGIAFLAESQPVGGL